MSFPTRRGGVSIFLIFELASSAIDRLLPFTILKIFCIFGDHNSRHQRIEGSNLPCSYPAISLQIFSRSVAAVGRLGREATQCSRFRPRIASLCEDISRRHSQRLGIHGLEMTSIPWIILLIQMIAVIISLPPRSYAVGDGEALTQGQGDDSVGDISRMLGGWRTSRNPSSGE